MVNCKHCKREVFPKSKAHGKKCVICGKTFCDHSGNGASHSPQTCSNKCKCILLARKSTGGKGTPKAAWPKCKLCHQPWRPSAKSKAHGRKCTICRKTFCDPNYRATCSDKCTQGALVRIGNTYSQKAQRASRRFLAAKYSSCNICGRLRMSAKSKYHNRICEHCQKPFCSFALKQVYCTPKCRYESEKTSIERWVESKLDSLGIRFKTQWKWKGVYKGRRVWGRADFLVGNLVIFADGTHWHADEIVQARDRMQSQVLSRLGYEVLRLQESEIQENPKATLVKIVNALSIKQRAQQCQ